jgi:hypothetical protein
MLDAWLALAPPNAKRPTPNIRWRRRRARTIPAPLLRMLSYAPPQHFSMPSPAAARRQLVVVRVGREQRRSQRVAVRTLCFGFAAQTIFSR